MLLWLIQYLMPYFHFLRVFQYLTFRSIIGVLTSLLIVLIFNPLFIRWLTRYQIGQMIRTDGPEKHLQKSGTPTMGGILILFSTAISVILWGDLTNRFILISLAVMIGFGFIGFVDDYRKLVKRNSRGLSARWKFLWQLVLGLAASCILFWTATTPAATQLLIPFFKQINPNLGWLFIPFSTFIIVGFSNAVNLTDGLDGLATLPTVLVAVALGVFAYLAGNHFFSHYLVIPKIPGAGEMTVFCSALVGAGLGFLWYNTYPAEVFMGDVGSLGLGATLGIIAVIVRQELLLCFMGGIFVAETLSVILQVAAFKLTRKRIFKMAPLHHHFELLGWSEPKIIVRFWIVTVVLVLCGLATLKLR